MHSSPHPLAGKTVKVKLVAPFHNRPDDTEFEVQIEDWQDRVMGQSWMFCDGNPAAMFYAIRTGLAGHADVPLDDEVVYTRDHYTHLSNLVHVNEITD